MRVCFAGICCVSPVFRTCIQAKRFGTITCCSDFRPKSFLLRVLCLFIKFRIILDAFFLRKITNQSIACFFVNGASHCPVNGVPPPLVASLRGDHHQDQRRDARGARPTLRRPEGDWMMVIQGLRGGSRGYEGGGW